MDIRSFLEASYIVLFYVGIGFLCIIPFVYIQYFLRFNAVRSLKDKYDYVIRNRVRNLKVTHVLVALVLFCTVNYFFRFDENETLSFIHVVVLFSISTVIAVAYLYFMFTYLNVYYGKRLYGILNRLRYTPRVNPNTGNQMKLLSEEEEDVYLDEGMQAEEDIFSVDYDVWVDPENKDVLIKRYPGGTVASECTNCGFQTLRLIKEEVVEAEIGGRKNVLQYYTCSYCATELEKVVNAREGNPTNQRSKQDNAAVEGVSLTVTLRDKSREVFDFNTLEQARNFISKYEDQQLAAANETTNETTNETEQDAT